jgi:hypothetical protein
MKAARNALRALDPESRALLDLSLRRGLEDEDIASVLRVDEHEVARRRADALARLAEDLQLHGRDQCDELLASLPDLPPEYWRAEGLAGRRGSERRREVPDVPART